MRTQIFPRFKRPLKTLILLALCLILPCQQVHAEEPLLKEMENALFPNGTLHAKAFTFVTDLIGLEFVSPTLSEPEPGITLVVENTEANSSVKDIETITLVKEPNDVEADSINNIESSQVYLIGTTDISMTTVEDWARSKGMSQEGLDLIPIYYHICEKKGLNPVIQYVQMCIETGWLYKTGSQAGLDTSYHNPCGLKTTAGGGNYDPNAHFRFDNWYDGIDAHTDHTALYAGVPGYPKEDSKDPRHFSYLFGIGDTVSLMGMRWVGKTPETDDGVYAGKILKLYNEILEWE